MATDPASPTDFAYYGRIGGRMGGKIAYGMLGADLSLPARQGFQARFERLADPDGTLPEEEREALDLVRIHGMTHTEAAEVLGVSSKTVQRRLNRAQLILTAALGDLRPSRSLRSES